MLKPPSEVTKVLLAAKNLIADPEKWWDGQHPRKDNRQQHCSATAIGATGCSESAGCAAMSRLALAIGTMPYDHAAVVRFNDSRTHAEVLAAFDKAIMMEEA